MAGAIPLEVLEVSGASTAGSTPARAIRKLGELLAQALGSRPTLMHGNMTRFPIAVAFQLLVAVALPAQQPSPRIAGDTSGGPVGCSAKTAAAVVANWFVAFQAADSVGLAKASATTSARGFVVSMGKFTPADPFVRIESIQSLVAHARRRARQHERLTLEGIRFFGWRGRVLGFMPYFRRSADDLGPVARPGFGKAEYVCGEGIAILNMGLRPAIDSGL